MDTNHKQQYKLVIKYFPKLSDVQKWQMLALKELYTAWNNRINLISRKDITNLYIRHVLHSLSIAYVVHFKPNAHVLDLGTGGGFPGIPLAILFPKVNFVLVDSVLKKIKAVQDIATRLQLHNVSTVCTRGEKMNNDYDFIVGRGVVGLDTFYAWTQHMLKTTSNHVLKNGILYLKGRDKTTDIENAGCDVYPIGDFFNEDFFITKHIVHLYPI